MTDPERDPPIEDQLLKEAATWFARMRGPDAEASRPGFEAWLARGALHRRAYNRASEIFAMGKLLAGETEAKGEGRRSPRAPPSRTALVAVAVIILVSVGLILLRPVFRHRANGNEIASRSLGGKLNTLLFVTRVDETRSVRLADGSVVRLESGTRLAVTLDRTSRRLTLEQGLARFQVAHEPRPFIVRAGGGSVTARGTIFDIALTNDRRVAVSLIEGTVDVSLPIADRAAKRQPVIRRLRPGETVSFAAVSDGSGQEPRASGESAMKTGGPTAAADGARDYDNVRLSDLIAEANRGAPQKIRLASAAMGERHVSGRFRIDDSDLLADRLAALFDFTVQRGSGIILLK
jgi:transmembrane sensor